MDTTIRKFTFVSSDGTLQHRTYPFRVGDIVTVKHWGESYSTYESANLHFTGNSATPYYNEFYMERNDTQKFKIMGIAEHSSGRDIVAYISDRSGKGAVICPDGLKLFKQYPLRINETETIKLEKIKRIIK